MSEQVKLPTKDQFRQQFRDAVRAGLPLEKCLDLGTTWGTGNRNKSGQSRDAFRKTFRDALSKGLPIHDSLRLAADASQT